MRDIRLDDFLDKLGVPLSPRDKVWRREINIVSPELCPAFLLPSAPQRFDPTCSKTRHEPTGSDPDLQYI
jgi:hypothetical protein